MFLVNDAELFNQITVQNESLFYAAFIRFKMCTCASLGIPRMKQRIVSKYNNNNNNNKASIFVSMNTTNPSYSKLSILH